MSALTVQVGIEQHVATGGSVIAKPADDLGGRVGDPVRLRRRPVRSIRSTWFTAIAMFVAIVAMTTIGTLWLTQVQRERFASTSSHFERDLDALTKLQKAVSDTQSRLTPILYELDGRVSLEVQWRHWLDDRARIDAHLRRLRSIADPHDARAVDDVAAAWERVVAGADAGRAMWGTGEATAALQRGADPFREAVWGPMAEIDGALASIAVSSVAHIRAESDRVIGQHKILGLAFAVIVAVSSMIAAGCAWRLSKRVIRPLLALRQSVAGHRDGAPLEPIAVAEGSGAELVDLAEALADMTTTLTANQARLRAHAYTDALTGLANRRAVNEILQDLDPQEDDDAAVIMIDVDDFKVVNDSYGHTAGDELLVAIAGRLVAAVRPQDVIARIGGDEFAVIAEGVDALAVARRILAALDEPFVVAGGNVEVGCSIGVADAHGVSCAKEIMARADSAMYIAKRRGKSSIEMFDPMLHSTMVARSTLRADLRHAAANDELLLHYQPVVDLDTDAVVGVEALLRWDHPERGLLMPGAFISDAEETGDIVAIGDWIVDRACAELTRWRREIMAPRLPWMAINVSARQLLATNLVDSVRGAMRRHDVEPELLVVEITEAALVADCELATTVLDTLRADGIRVAVDDFGTGFSSLEYLARLPVDIVKIDRTFIERSGDNGRADVILGSIVSMSRRLGLEIIAEGIEQRAELERVRQLGCTLGQGYLLSRPASADETLLRFDHRGDGAMHANPSAGRRGHRSAGVAVTTEIDGPEESVLEQITWWLNAPMSRSTSVPTHR